MRRNETLLDSLLELQSLDRLPRTGYVLRGVADPESVSEHSWHVVLLVWALSPRVEGLDVRRALELAIVHDLPEIRIGDLPSTAGRYWPDGAKATAEAEAIAELLAPLGRRGPELLAEFSAAESREARFVRACDKLQLMIKVWAYERHGAGGLAEFWDNPANFPSDEFETVSELIAALRRRRDERSPR